ncbi:tyrosine-protein kinase family protein, partial [bacterium]
MARTVVIFSTKGGVGKTLFSANLAVSLAQANQRVCLVDLDIHGGNDMSRMLNLDPQKAMVDFMHHLKKYPENTKKEDFIT